MNIILKKQILAGLMDLTICTIPGVIVYFTSGLPNQYEFLNIINIIGFIYLAYILLSFLMAGRSPGDNFYGIILINAKTGKVSRLHFLIKEFLKILFIFYISLLDPHDFEFGNAVVIVSFIMLLFPSKFKIGDTVHYSIINFVSKTLYKDLLEKSSNINAELKANK